LASLVDKSELKDRRELKIVDMARQGFPTLLPTIISKYPGVDVQTPTNASLSICATACEKACSSTGCRRQHSDSMWADMIFYSPHACNTATDDAIYKGIAANADLIVRPVVTRGDPPNQAPDMFRDILKHGVSRHRRNDHRRPAVIAARAKRLFDKAEFVSVEIPKNNMLIGMRFR
jgi:hypothetical protein